MPHFMFLFRLGIRKAHVAELAFKRRDTHMYIGVPIECIFCRIAFIAIGTKVTNIFPLFQRILRLLLLLIGFKFDPFVQSVRASMNTWRCSVNLSAKTICILSIFICVIDYFNLAPTFHANSACWTSQMLSYNTCIQMAILLCAAHVYACFAYRHRRTF